MLLFRKQHQIVDQDMATSVIYSAYSQRCSLELVKKGWIQPSEPMAYRVFELDLHQKNAYLAIKNALLSHKNGICTFMSCGILT